jgi:hypothetical protein
MSQTALHEAAHALAARKLKVAVLHVIATGENPHCRVRYRINGPIEEATDALHRQAVIALAGPQVEHPGSSAAETDRLNALRYCCEAIAAERGNSLEALDANQLLAALNLFDRLATVAADLVKKNLPLIARLAHRLEDAGELSGAAVNMIIGGTQEPVDPRGGIFAIRRYVETLARNGRVRVPKN